MVEIAYDIVLDDSKAQKLQKVRERQREEALILGEDRHRRKKAPLCGISFASEKHVSLTAPTPLQQLLLLLLICFTATFFNSIQF